MNMHENARLTPHSRAELVRRVTVEGQTLRAVAAAFGVTIKTADKWLARFNADGAEGLKDRSSRPHRLHRPTPAVIVEKVEALRRQRWTGKQIAAEAGVSPATVSRILRRLGLNRIAALEPAEPVRRYEREKPGELIHIDIKKLVSPSVAQRSRATFPRSAYSRRCCRAHQGRACGGRHSFGRH